MIIDVEEIRHLPRSEETFNYALEADFWKDERLAGLTFCTEPSVELQVQVISDEVRIKGHITGKVIMECSRCLHDAIIDIDHDFEETYLSRTDRELKHMEEKEELSEEDLSTNWYDGLKINADDFLVDIVLLTLPAFALCSEDCKGFCQTCGADLNIGPCNCNKEILDPRMAALGALLEKKRLGSD